MKVAVDVKGYSHEIIGSYNPSDGWDRPDTTFVYEGLDVWGSEDDPDKAALRGFYGTKFEVDASIGDEVYVLVAKYSTGDTFGHDDGRVTIVDVFSNAALAEKILSELYPAKGFSHKASNGVDYYICWTGYFEALEALFVEPAIVRRPIE